MSEHGADGSVLSSGLRGRLFESGCSDHKTKVAGSGIGRDGIYPL